MTVDVLIEYLEQYGYYLMILFAFFGIVGIPAPEETLLFLIGMLIAERHFGPVLSVLSSVGGTFLGMLAAYVIGRCAGGPFLRKFGKWLGLSGERWIKAERNFRRNSSKTVLFGFYLPGIRQISPYFSGMAHIPFPKFALLSFIGSLLWVLPYLLAGYWLGSIFHINPEYVPYAGIILFFLFILYFAWKWLKSRQVQ